QRDRFSSSCASTSTAPESCRLQETLLTRRRFGRQVVDCAPVARRYATRRRFPWTSAPLVIRRLFATPENVADAQSLSGLAPVRGSTHQGRELPIGIVVIESFSPQMARITQNDFAA